MRNFNILLTLDFLTSTKFPTFTLLSMIVSPLNLAKGPITELFPILLIQCDKNF